MLCQNKFGRKTRLLWFIRNAARSATNRKERRNYKDLPKCYLQDS